jgi:hypothetical protein
MMKTIKFKLIYFFKDLIHLNLDMVRKKVDDHCVFFFKLKMQKFDKRKVQKKTNIRRNVF